MFNFRDFLQEDLNDFQFFGPVIGQFDQLLSFNLKKKLSLKTNRILIFCFQYFLFSQKQHNFLPNISSFQQILQLLENLLHQILLNFQYIVMLEMFMRCFCCFLVKILGLTYFKLIQFLCARI